MKNDTWNITEKGPPIKHKEEELGKNGRCYKLNILSKKTTQPMYFQCRTLATLIFKYIFYICTKHYIFNEMPILFIIILYYISNLVLKPHYPMFITTTAECDWRLHSCTVQQLLFISCFVNSKSTPCQFTFTAPEIIHLLGSSNYLPVSLDTVMLLFSGDMIL